MAVQLQRGEFFGTTTTRNESNGVLLSCLRHADPRKLPVHAHESAFFTMLLRGAYREQAGSREIHYDPLTVVFHPPSLAHFDEIGSGDSTMVSVEVSPQFFADNQLALPPLARQSFAAARCLLGLYRAARLGVLTPLEVESGVIELVADAAKTREVADHGTPPWLARVLEMLRARPSAHVRVLELAREANVHPVHLTRVFRRVLGTTPGEYLQRLRLQNALRLLAGRNASLSDVALASGFADQSHFCRAVRASLGVTPRMLVEIAR